MKIIAFITIILSSSAFADYEIYFTKSDTINFARDRFYSSLKEEIYNSKDYIDETLNHLNRKELVRAHPPAQRDYKKTQIKVPLKINKMIIQIQRDLETKAKDLAMIVDCKTIKSQYVSNCGLYRYSRIKQKIDASSVRYFSVLLEQPEKWASPLLKNFSAQNAKEKGRNEAKLMNTFMKSLDKKAKTTNNLNSMASLGVKLRNTPSSNLNGIYAEFSRGENDFYTTLAIANYDSIATQNKALVKSIGLEFGAKNLSKPVYKLKWEIAYKAHLDFNEYSDGLKSEKILGASIASGFNARLDSKGNTLLHTSYAVKRNIKLSNEHDVLDSSFWESNWSINISRLF